MTAAPTQVATALGLHHTLPTALADLVDNSLDAGARHVLVRFLQDGIAIVGIRIVDDGAGMSGPELDDAMAYRRRASYQAGDLGHFGVGLKAASFSQADRLTVWSRTVSGRPAGRHLARPAPTDVEIADDAEAVAEFDRVQPRFPMHSGTVVDWRGVRSALSSTDAAEQTSWLEATIGDVRSHLGVVFHRRIAAGLRITIDVFDVGRNRAGAQRTATATDPFGYPAPARAGYPLHRTIDIGSASIPVALHLWPARSTLPEYRLGGVPGRDLQGLYVYRNDRLMQVGGWCGLVRARTEFGAARVALELTRDVEHHITINPEKSGVTLDATAVEALRAVLGVGRGGAPTGFLADAAAVVSAARSQRPRPITLVEPESGLPEDVLDEIADSVEFATEAAPVAIGWRVLARDAFFEVDLPGRTLWLNARFRRALVGGRSTDNTDLPIVRSLLYLLTEEMFRGTRHSRRQVEKMQAWQSILLAAVNDQLTRKEIR